MVHAGDFRAKRLALVAMAAMFLAGALHLAIIPHHWAHAPAHGLFFLLSGILQIGWVLAYWRTRSPSLSQAGFVMALALILLWALTRVIRAPFGHGPEEIDTAGLATKACEAICAAALGLLIAATFFTQPRHYTWRPILGLALASILLAGLAYGVALAAEPFLPGLAPNATEEHEHAPQEEQHELPAPTSLLLHHHI